MYIKKFPAILLAMMLLIGISTTALAQEGDWFPDDDDDTTQPKDDPKVDEPKDDPKVDEPKTDPNDTAKDLEKDAEKSHTDVKEVEKGFLDGLEIKGKVGHRFQISLYQAETSPDRFNQMVSAQLFLMYDMTDVRLQLVFKTAGSATMSGIPGSAKWVTYQNLNNLIVGFSNAFFAYKASDNTWLTGGRFPFVVDNKLGYKAFVSDATFDSDYSLDGLGLFSKPSEDLGFFAAASPLAEDVTGEKAKYAYLLWAQIRYQLAMDANSLLIGGGVYAVLLPHLLSYGETIVIEAFACFHLVDSKIKLTAHFVFNAGAEEDPMGMLFEFKYNNADEPGTWEFVGQYFMNQAETSPWAYQGRNWHGIQAKLAYVISKHFKMNIALIAKDMVDKGSLDDTGILTIKIDFEACFGK